jgi:glycine betaine/proline transport system ATP-binding protein
MQDELMALQARLRKTIVFITHDLGEALRLGDRIAFLKDAGIVQIGTPAEILNAPADDYVRAFVRQIDRAAALAARHRAGPVATAL